MKTLRVLAVIGALLLTRLSSQATLLYLNPDLPDFMGSFVSVTYNSTTGLFQATGFTTDYQGGSVSLMDVGSYTITATISGGVLTTGSVNIQGDIGSGVQTLLTGTLNTGAEGTAFGSVTGGGNIFEFLFTVTGGQAAVMTDFGGFGAADRGIILDAWFQNGGTPFDGTWNTSFSNDGYSGLGDSFAPVPEPSSALLILMTVAIFAARRHGLFVPAYSPARRSVGPG